MLSAHTITYTYPGQNHPALNNITLTIPDGSFTVILGPNACGKSTLLKTLARTLTPQSGTVTLDGDPLATLRPKQIARRLALLPQSPLAPAGIRVKDLVARGRYPHLGLLGRYTPADDAAIEQALAATGLSDLADRYVTDLSGGQRQRVWIALVLAQDTPTILLDEPTTYLDISHQIDVLSLAASLHRNGRTIVAVLHELGLALRFATNVILMKDGDIVAHGPVHTITADLLEHTYGIPIDLHPDPHSNRPLVVPRIPATPQPPKPHTP